MTEKSYTTTFAVDQSPVEVFAAINNVRGWWSEEIEGPTNKAGGKFKYHFRDMHHCEVRVDELIPGKKVAWTFVDSYFSFTKDAAEWKDTRVVFDIAGKGGKTAVTFTHVGLVPHFECYSACSDGWRTYINGSLKDLITAGRGQPNKGEAITESEQALSRQVVPATGAARRTPSMTNRSFTTSITVRQSPDEVFAAVNHVKKWWDGELEGGTTKLGDEFTYRYKDIHSSTQRITELVPGKKVVWHVVNSRLNFVENKTEWTGTDIVFDIERAGDETELRFTHEGLNPDFECFEDCSGAWGEIIGGSLRSLIAKEPA